MPQFEIQDSQTGTKLTVEGEAAPTPQDAEELFNSYYTSNVKLSPGEAAGMNQPSQLSSGQSQQPPTADNPDWQFTIATGGNPTGKLVNSAISGVMSNIVEPAATSALQQMGVDAQEGKPLISSPGIDAYAARKGIGPSIVRNLQSFTTPGNALTLGLAPESKSIQAVFMAGAAGQIPDNMVDLAQAKTAAEFRDAATTMGINTGMAMLMRHALDAGQKSVGRTPETPTQALQNPETTAPTVDIPPVESAKAATEPPTAHEEADGTWSVGDQKGLSIKQAQEALRKQQESYANRVEEAVEVPGNPPSEPAAQVAEGGAGGVPQPSPVPTAKGQLQQATQEPITQDSRAADSARYQQLLGQTKGKGWAEMGPIMQEIEQIKNRNGGMVPAQTPGVDPVPAAKPDEPIVAPTPDPQAETAKLGEYQGIFQANLYAAGGAPLRVMDDDESRHNPDNAPFSSSDRRLAVADQTTGQIFINGPMVDRWLSNMPVDQRSNAVRSLLSEERVHLATDNTDAFNYWNTLTGLEKWATQKRYGTGKNQLSDTNWGHEAIRFQLQRAMRMTPTEFVNAMAGYRSSTMMHTVTALEDVVRGIRTNLLKTKSSAESLAILRKVSDNLKYAKFVGGGGTPAAISPENAEDTAREMEHESELYRNTGDTKSADEMLEMARWIRQKGNEDSFAASHAPELPGFEGGEKKKPMAGPLTKAAELEKLTGKEPTQGFVDTQNRGRPPKEKVDWANKKQPVLWNEEGPLLYPGSKPPELPTTQELNQYQVPRTPEQIDATADDVVGRAVERSVDAYSSGGQAPGGTVGVPQFKDFVRQMQQRNRDLDYDNLLTTYSRAISKRLSNASDEELMKLSKAEFGEGSRRGSVTLPGGAEKVNPALAEAVRSLPYDERRALMEKFLPPDTLAEMDRQEDNRRRLSSTVNRLDYTAQRAARDAQEEKNREAMTPQQRLLYDDAKIARAREMAPNRKFKNTPKEVSPATVKRQDEQRIKQVQRNRARIISTLYKESMTDAMRQNTAMLTRKSITPDDIKQGGYSFIDSHGDSVVMPSHYALDPNGVGRDTLDALTRKNRRNSQDDWRTSRKVATFQDKATREVHQSSVWQKHSSTGHDIRFTDPQFPDHEAGLQYGPNFFNKYRLLYSTLLEDPVRNFHQKFDDIHDYNEKFGNEAQRNMVTGEGRYVEKTAEEREAEEAGIRQNPKWVKSFMADPSDPRGAPMGVWTDPVSGEVVERDDTHPGVEREPVDAEHVEGLPSTQVNHSSSFMGPHAGSLREEGELARNKFSRGPLSDSQARSLFSYLKAKGNLAPEDAIKAMSWSKHPNVRSAIAAVVKLSRDVARDNPTLSGDELIRLVSNRIHLASIAASDAGHFSELLGAKREPTPPKLNEAAPPGKELTMPIDRRPPTDVRPENLPPGYRMPDYRPAEIASPVSLNPDEMRFLSPEDSDWVRQQMISREEESKTGPRPTTFDYSQMPGASSGAPIRTTGQVVSDGIDRVGNAFKNAFTLQHKEAISVLKNVADNLPRNAGLHAGMSVHMEQLHDRGAARRAMAALAKGDFHRAGYEIGQAIGRNRWSRQVRESAIALLHAGAVRNRYIYTPEALERMSEIRKDNPDLKLASTMMRGDLNGAKREMMQRVKDGVDVDPTTKASKWQGWLDTLNRMEQETNAAQAEQGRRDAAGKDDENLFSEEGGKLYAESRFEPPMSIRGAGAKLWELSMRNLERQLVNEGLLTHKGITRVFDPSVKGRLDYFMSQLNHARQDAARIMLRGDLGENAIQRQRIAAIDKLQHGLDFAKANWGNEELFRVAARSQKEFDDSFDREKAGGSQLRYDEGYVPGRYDAELFSDGNWMFQKPRVMGRNAAAAKAFQNHYDAIEAGPYVPLTHDIANLVQHRVQWGTARLENQSFYKSLTGLFDEHMQMPAYVKTKLGLDGKTVADPPKGFSRSDYTVIRDAGDQIAARNGSYENLINTLLKPSIVSDSPIRGALLRGSQFLKHATLVGDFYHFAKIAELSLASNHMDPRMNYKSGLSVLNYREEDIPRAVQSGLITPQAAQYALEKITVRLNGQQRLLSRVQVSQQLLQRQGYNVAQIQDAIYKDIVGEVPKMLTSFGLPGNAMAQFTGSTFGKWNKFLFDEWTRGLMGQRGVDEFERLQQKNPNMDANVIARGVAKDLNVLFGNLGKESWIKSKTWQDVARMFFLAPNWTEGMVRKSTSVGRLATNPGRVLSGNESLTGPMLLGTLSMLATTQIASMIINGKPTWQNTDPRESLSLQMGKNLYYNPMSTYLETINDVTRYSETKDNMWDAIQTIGENKLGPVGRAALVMASGNQPGGQHISGFWNRPVQAAKQLVPVPITVSKPVQALAHKVAPSMVPGLQPQEAERQGLASAGVKTEFGRLPYQQMMDSAQQWKKANGKSSPRMESTDEPSYTKLRQSVNSGDDASAKQMLDALRKTHTDNQIVKDMVDWVKEPFTGSKTDERLWLSSMNSQELKMYQAAMAQKLTTAMQFEQFYQRHWKN